MRGFLVVFSNISVFAEAASQAYSKAFRLSTSDQYLSCFINFAEDPPSLAKFAVAQVQSSVLVIVMRKENSMANKGSWLSTGAYLSVNDYLVAGNGQYFAIMQGDGNFVIYQGSDPTHQGAFVWNSGPAPGLGQYFAIMQGDGNFVIYQGSDPTHQGAFVWNSGPAPGLGQYFAIMQDNGNFVLYHGSGPSQQGAFIWDIKTALGPDGTLLKASGPEVDRMEAGQRRWIPDPPTFNCMGLNWGAIQTISDSVWNLIPQGAPYPSRADGALVQGSGPQVYVMAACQRHGIPDLNTFDAQGYNLSAIQYVSDADLTAIAEGAPLPAGPLTITVAYQQFGPPPYPDADWWTQVKQQFEASNPDVKIKLVPIIADEGGYYTQVDLMMRSASTAPDIVREDSFLVASDATAGYLAPLESYLTQWSEYQQQWFPTMQQIPTFNGHNYGLMNGTDTRLIWYNKDIFQKAGLPTDWQPNNWADILTAARTIKAKVPGVIPMNLYSGIPMNEASTMQGFEMLLYGTYDPLYNYNTKKWVVSSKGFQDALDFVRQVYNPSGLLGPSNDIALSTQAANTVSQQLLPQGKLGIAIDGSWLPGNWASTGAAPSPQWQTTLGMAKMPTQFGQDPKFVTLSGGWAHSITAQSQHKDLAFQILKLAYSKDLLADYDVKAAQIAPRKDIVGLAAYKSLPGNDFFSSLVAFTQFRPGFPAYPKISVQIGSAMQQVMSGKSSTDAMAAYAQAVVGIVGANNIERRI